MNIFPHNPDDYQFVRRTNLRAYHFRRYQHPALGAWVAVAVIVVVAMVVLWLA